MKCVYCERPLECQECGVEYEPPDLEHHLALSRQEVAIPCASCGAILVCRWCRTPYDGEIDGLGETDD